jgi:hypothetical protein
MPIKKPPWLGDFFCYHTTWDERTKQCLPYRDRHYFGWDFTLDKISEEHDHRTGYITYSGWRDIEEVRKTELDEATRLALGLQVQSWEWAIEEGRIETGEIGPRRVRRKVIIRDLNYGWVLWGEDHDCGLCTIVYSQLWLHALKQIPYETIMWTIPAYVKAEPKPISPFQLADYKIQNLSIETNPLFNPKAVIIEENGQYSAQESITLEEIHEPM